MSRRRILLVLLSCRHLGLLLGCQGGDLFPRLGHARAGLLLELIPYLVQGHQRRCALDVALGLPGKNASVSRRPSLRSASRGPSTLTSDSRFGVPGMDPWVELERVIGGVSIRRPKLSNRAGEAVRDTTAEADATRWWWRWSGTLRAPAAGGGGRAGGAGGAGAGAAAAAGAGGAI